MRRPIFGMRRSNVTQILNIRGFCGFTVRWSWSALFNWALLNTACFCVRILVGLTLNLLQGGLLLNHTCLTPDWDYILWFGNIISCLRMVLRNVPLSILWSLILILIHGRVIQLILILTWMFHNGLWGCDGADYWSTLMRNGWGALRRLQLLQFLLWLLLMHFEFI